VSWLRRLISRELGAVPPSNPVLVVMLEVASMVHGNRRSQFRRVSTGSAGGLGRGDYQTSLIHLSSIFSFMTFAASVRS
jgi:hypothetical protein